MTQPRTSMRDRLRETLVERILVGAYPAGTRLKELALAAEFHVSQAPVREALRELEAFGLVQSERYRGARVRAADIQELREAYELRALIEDRAAQLAVPCAPEVLQTLERAYGIMKRTVGDEDHKEHAAAATLFHRTIVVASGNVAFLRTWDALHWEIRTRVALRQLRERRIDVRPFMAAHERVLRALKAGNGIEAGRLLRQTLQKVLRAIERPSGHLTRNGSARKRTA